MNNIYRLIWNASLGVWMAVSEFAKAQGKGKGSSRKRKLVISAALLTTVLASPAQAWVINPGSITNGGTAANDGGVASNVAIGSGADSSGSPSQGTAVGNLATVGQGGTALGGSAKATGVNSSSFGLQSSATGPGGTAVGYRSSASGELSVVVGNGGIASGTAATAVGTNTRSDGVGSTAIGWATKAMTDSATAIGREAVATGEKSTAIGSLAKADAASSTAIGDGANAKNANDVALGSGSVTRKAIATEKTTIGGVEYLFAGTTPSSTVSIGDVGEERTLTNLASGQLTASSTDAVNGSQLFATNSQVGTNTTNIATNTANIAKNTTNIANNTTNIAKNAADIVTNTLSITNLGNTVENIYQTGTKYFHAKSTGEDSVALGQDSVAIGMGAVSANTNDVALGAGSITLKAHGTPNATIGGTLYNFAGANPVSTVSIGSQGSERTLTNLAAGNLSSSSTDAVNGSQLFATNQAVDTLQDDALKWDSTLGAFSATHGTTAVNKITNVANATLNASSTDAVNGSQLYATNQNVATNTTNITQNTQDISDLGDSLTNIYNNGTKYFHANSTGEDSHALGLDSVAIGSGAVSIHQNDVALGAGSVTSAAQGTSGVKLNDTDYTFAGAKPTSTVSIGDVGSERTLTNLAAGRLSGNSTDAVNGSQLFATNNALSSLNTDFEGLQTDALLWNKTLGAYSASHDGIVVNKITNVADGALNESSSDAVNGSQLFATNQQVNTNTTNIEKNTEDITVLGDTVDNIFNTGTKYFHANSTGADSLARGIDSVAIGMGAVSLHQNDVALGAGSITAVTVGTSGVKLGDTEYTFAGANPSSTVSIGDVGSERTLTNLAAGRLSATSTDAVNGSQLFATNSAVSNLTTNVDGLRDDALLWDTSLNAFSASHGSTTVNKITHVAAGELNETSTDAVNGSQLYATNQKVENIDGRLTNVENVVYDNIIPTMRYLKVNSTGADAVASGADAIALGQSTMASGDNSVAAGNGAVSSGDGAVATGKKANASGESSVAVGENASALAKNSVALGAGSVADRENSVSVGSAGNERQITNVAAGTQDTDAVNLAQLKEVSGDITNIGNTVNNISDGTDGMFQVNNTDKHPKPVVTGKNAVAGGAGSKASGDNSMAIGTGSHASGQNSVALGNGSSATASNSVAIGANSVADRANSVSMGSAGKERQVTNVAAGTALTDAANVGQLRQSESNANQYTNNKFNSLKNMVDDQKDKLSAGIAGAMAMATLPQPYSAGASMVGMAGGTYQGQSAVALGVSTISDNGKWVTKLSGTTTSQGDFGAAVGVGYQW